MRLLFKCHAEGDGPSPDYAVLNLDGKTAESILVLHGLYLECLAKDKSLSEMAWTWNDAPITFFDIGQHVPPPVFGCKDFLILADDDAVFPVSGKAKGTQEVTPEKITLEVWPNADIVFGGLMRGADYHRFSTDYVPKHLIEEAVNSIPDATATQRGPAGTAELTSL